MFRPKNLNRMYAAEIALVEVVSALTRRHRGKALSDSARRKVRIRFRRDFDEKLFTIETNLSIIEQAAELAEKHALRGYDAVQLASAVYLHDRRQKAKLSALTFISADNALNSAAAAEGLAVDNPNDHP